MEYTKQCKVCMATLTADKFKSDRRSIDNLATICNSCLEEREVHAAENIYLHEALYIKQKFRCAICNRKVFLSKILVDSDPETDETMGLLCRRCNKLLRLADRQIGVLQAAVEYLIPIDPEPVDPPRPPGRHEFA